MRNVRRNRRRARKRNPTGEEAQMRSIQDLNRSEIESAGFQWIHGRNGERDRKILLMYLLDGITYERMQNRLEADGYPLSIDGLKKIIRKRKAELFRHI